ncbi:MAG: hypothetical protein EU529_01980 [Promethearchaeota archaeon]|nr:MAG: hypothetical protein EU529_01980 [Candidatus Lokiarchaeota archaeon]
MKEKKLINWNCQFFEGRFFFDLLLSTSKIDRNTKIGYINKYVYFDKLNDIASEILSGIELKWWGILYDKYKENGELNEDQVRLFITLFAKIYDINDINRENPLKWYELDLDKFYSTKEYIIEVNERFTEALYLNYL